MTRTIQLTQGIGYRGKRGLRVYVAEIGGTDETYGLAREFIDADEVTRDHFGRSRYLRTYTWHLLPGLYEMQSEGDRFYRVIYDKNGELKCTRIERDRATRIAELIGEGQGPNEARLATRPSV